MTPGTVRIWDPDGPKLIRPPLRLGDRVLGLAFGPDGSQLAIDPFGRRGSRSTDGGERSPRCRPASGSQLARDEVSLAFSPDGRLLAGGQQ